MEITGKFGTAKIFTDLIEDEAVSQIYGMLNNDVTEGSFVRIMPDVHAGKGCTIGTTIKLNGKVCPNLVGVDIGCGMLVSEILNDSIDLKAIDDAIKKYVKFGTNIYDKAIISKSEENYWCLKLSSMFCRDSIDIPRSIKSIASLGGGNHFIEIDENEDKSKKYLVIHTGSRHLGLEVCKYYMDAAYKQMRSNIRDGVDVKGMVEKLKAEGRQAEISAFLSKNKKSPINKELAYCTDELYGKYMHDIEIVQEFALSNRLQMALLIAKKCGLNIKTLFDTRHNYIDTTRGILRKGAVSAERGETLIIPMNMRDGSLICRGKGNPDWNYSAPHGAGRIMSRSKAKQVIGIDEFRKSMEGIYSTTICDGTIDEAPQAYKPIESILSNIKDTVDVVSIIKPIYNFKAIES